LTSGVPAVVTNASPRTSRPTTTLWDLAEVRFALAQVAVIAAVLGCGAVGLGLPPTLLVVASVTVRCAAPLPASYGIGVGAAAWAWITGFVVNAYGDLTFTGPDLVRLALMLSCGLAAHWIR
jgi:hypothetical protein